MDRKTDIALKCGNIAAVVTAIADKVGFRDKPSIKWEEFFQRIPLYLVVGIVIFLLTRKMDLEG